MVQVPLKSGPDRWNASSLEETYWIIGDRDSIISVMASMVDWCHAEPIWPDAFNPAESAIGVAGDATGQGVRLHPGNILQYYRATTFALAHPAYNNSYAYFPLNTSTLLTHDQSTPLNNVMKYSAWLRCINETIANALPILDDGPPSDNNPISLAFILVLTVVCTIINTYLCILSYTTNRGSSPHSRDLKEECMAVLEGDQRLSMNLIRPSCRPHANCMVVLISPANGPSRPSRVVSLQKHSFVVLNSRRLSETTFQVASSTLWHIMAFYRRSTTASSANFVRLMRRFGGRTRRMQFVICENSILDWRTCAIPGTSRILRLCAFWCSPISLFLPHSHKRIYSTAGINSRHCVPLQTLPTRIVAG